MVKLIGQLLGIVVIAALVIALWPGAAAEESGAAATAVPTIAPSSTAADPAIPLRPAQSAAGDGFGQAIAVNDTTAVIGAPQAGDGRGTVTIFSLQNGRWQETASLTASDGAPGHTFGQSVAISGQTILVGASGHNAAYVFEQANGRWRQTAKLLPDSPQDFHFGRAVALAGETAVVGAPYRYSQGEMVSAGSAAVFTRQGQAWRLQTRLTSGQSGGRVGSDLFGWAVAAQGNTIAVGAHLQDKVYLYESSNGQWQETAVIQGDRGGQFGYSLALASPALLVGAPATDAPVTRGGTAVLFMRQAGGKWAETARFAPEGLRPGSRFGWSAALSGNVAVVGMRESEGQQDVEESGGTFAFRIANGVAAQPLALYAPNPAPFAHMGTAVAVNANAIFVGAPGTESAPGTVYIFNLEEN
jgi:hypothetical protein